MEQLRSLPANNFDIFMLIMWLILALHNRQSLVMFATLVAYIAIQATTATNFHAFLLTSSLYFCFAQVNIKFLSAFRKVFISFGVVYFLGAIDQAVYYHFDLNTYFDRIQPYLVTIVNAYVLALLIGGGGKQDAGFADYVTAAFNRCIARLSLHKESHKHLSNGKTQ